MRIGVRTRRRGAGAILRSVDVRQHQVEDDDVVVVELAISSRPREIGRVAMNPSARSIISMLVAVAESSSTRSTRITDLLGPETADITGFNHCYKLS